VQVIVPTLVLPTTRHSSRPGWVPVRSLSSAWACHVLGSVPPSSQHRICSVGPIARTRVAIRVFAEYVTPVEVTPTRLVSTPASDLTILTLMEPPVPNSVCSR
jgi:hypothetical protein